MRSDVWGSLPQCCFIAAEEVCLKILSYFVALKWTSSLTPYQKLYQKKSNHLYFFVGSSICRITYPCVLSFSLSSPARMSVCASLCLSVAFSVHLYEMKRKTSAIPSVYLSLFWLIYMSARWLPSVRLSFCLLVCLPVSVFVYSFFVPCCPSACRSACLYIYPKRNVGRESEPSSVRWVSLSASLSLSPSFSFFFLPIYLLFRPPISHCVGLHVRPFVDPYVRPRGTTQTVAVRNGIGTNTSNSKTKSTLVCTNDSRGYSPKCWTRKSTADLTTTIPKIFPIGCRTCE